MCSGASHVMTKVVRNQSLFGYKYIIKWAKLQATA